jgi:hypothetical protein
VEHDMFILRNTQRRVAAIGAASALLAVVTTACTDAPPPTSSRDASLTAQVAANDSLIRSAAAATRRDSARPGTTPGTPTAVAGYAFPASLALSTAQQNQIVALRAAFGEQTAKDAADYNAIVLEARNARAAGASAASIDAIVAKGSAIAERLRSAEAALQTAIEAVLTPAQREWLARCATPRSLTAAQTQQIADLERAFEQAMAADLKAIADALGSITALRASNAGSSAVESQIRTIIDGVTPARERLRTAQQKLAADIAKITGTSSCEG